MKKKYFSGPMSRNQRKALGRTINALKKARVQCILLMASANSIIKGKLGFTKSTADAKFLVDAKAIHAALVLNTGGYYTPPFTGMALFLTQIEAFSTAIDNMKLGVLGAAGAKRAAKTMLMFTLISVLDYVNNLARLDQLFSFEIITGAKLLVNGSKSGGKPDFSVRQGATGEVIMDCKAVMVGDKYVTASYDWQRSEDKGVTWINLRSTTSSKTNVAGLDLGDQSFRKRTNSQKAGVTAWCTPIVFNVQ